MRPQRSTAFSWGGLALLAAGGLAACRVDMVTRMEPSKFLEVIVPSAASVPLTTPPPRRGAASSQDAPAESENQGDSVCFYELAPPLEDRRWSQPRPLSALRKNPRGNVEIPLPRGQVEVDLYNCEDPFTTVWASRNAASRRSVRVTVADIVVARADRLLGDDDTVDNSPLMRDLETQLKALDTPSALELRAVVDQALGKPEAAVADLERAAHMTQSRTPIAAADTSTMPRRADLLGELADELRHSGQRGQALDAYRTALNEWNEVLRDADITPNASDFASRAVILARLESAGSVPHGTAHAEFARVLRTRDDRAAEILLRYLAVEGDPVLAHEAIYDTSVLSFPDAQYWKIYIAMLYMRRHAKWPKDLADDLAGLAAKVGEHGDGDPSQWTGLMVRAFMKDDRRTWSRMNELADDRIRFVTEATFLQALLRWAEGRLDEARKGFATVLDTHAVMLIEYAIAADALVALENK